VAEHAIACEWERKTNFLYTEEGSQVDSLRKEADAAAEAGKVIIVTLLTHV
jgi:hypothetical protein